MRIRDLVVEPVDRDWVPIQVKVDRHIAYEFKEIAKQNGFTLTQILEGAMKQFIIEERPRTKFQGRNDHGNIEMFD